MTRMEASVPDKPGFSWTLIAVSLPIVAALGLCALVAFKAFLVEWRVFHPPRGPVARPASAPPELAELGITTVRPGTIRSNRPTPLPFSEHTPK